MAAKSLAIKDYKKIPGEIDPNDPTTYIFPQVASKRNAKPTYWRIIVRLVEANIYDERGEDSFRLIADEYFNNKPISNTYGWIKVLSKVGENGKVKKAPPTYVKSGKNIGKANQTNVFTQALRDALSKYNKQLQKSREDIVAPITLYPPMLAQEKSKQKSPVDYSREVYIQKKFNGVRVVSAAHNGQIIMYSRARHIYPGFSHIRPELGEIFAKYPNIYLDGEVYKHGVDLQIISGTARKEIGAECVELKLDYYIFDCFDPARPDLTFSQRLAIIQEIEKNFGHLIFVKFVETNRVKNEEEAQAFYQHYLSGGYEGAILRLDAPYKYSYNDYHSSNLLKMKPVHDAEFRIIGYTSGRVGKAEGVLMFILQTKSGKEFTINLGMPIEERKELYAKMGTIEDNGKTHFENHYKGKLLTVMFDELSSDGVPVRARTQGIVLRNYE